MCLLPKTWSLVPFMHILVGAGPRLNYRAELRGMGGSSGTPFGMKGFLFCVRVRAHPSLVLTTQQGIRNPSHNSSCLLSDHQGHHRLISCKTGECFRKLDLHTQGHRHRAYPSKTPITEIHTSIKLNKPLFRIRKAVLPSGRARGEQREKRGREISRLQLSRHCTRHTITKDHSFFLSFPFFLKMPQHRHILTNE